MAKGSHFSWLRDAPTHPRVCFSCDQKVTLDNEHGVCIETLYIHNATLRRTWHLDCRIQVQKEALAAKTRAS